MQHRPDLCQVRVDFPDGPGVAPHLKRISLFDIWLGLMVIDKSAGEVVRDDQDIRPPPEEGFGVVVVALFELIASILLHHHLHRKAKLNSGILSQHPRRPADVLLAHVQNLSDFLIRGRVLVDLLSHPGTHLGLAESVPSLLQPGRDFLENLMDDRASGGRQAVLALPGAIGINVLIPKRKPAQGGFQA